MNPLITNFFILLFIAFICSVNNKGLKDHKTAFFIAYSFLMLLIFRVFLNIYSVPDLLSYEIGYKQISNMNLIKVPFGYISDIKMDEPGFRILMKIPSYLSSNFYFFLFCYSIVWLYGYFKVILKYSDYVILSILLLLVGSYNQSIFVIRQHMAILIVFMSYPYIINKSLRKYLLMIVLAFSMHQTALIALPLYFLYHIRNRKILIIVFIVCTIFLYLGISFLLNYIGMEVLDGYSSYVNSDIQTNSTGVFIIAIELFFYIFFLKKNVWDNGINRLLFIVLTFGFIVNLCGIGFNPTSRMTMYFTSVSFLSIPKTISYINSPLMRFAFMMSYLVLALYLCFYGSGFEHLKEYGF